MILMLEELLNIILFIKFIKILFQYCRIISFTVPQIVQFFVKHSRTGTTCHRKVFKTIYNTYGVS
jgi:hypothetical protein